MIHIRPATEADFVTLLQVQQEAFGEYTNVYSVSGWTTETLDSLKHDAKDKRIFVAESEGTVV
jgi:predicted N-acetyltransferase YhbS